MKTLANNVRLIGNLGRDPEVRRLENGKTMARFSMATTDVYTGNDGGKIENTQWHNIVAWGNLATIIERICRKGFQVLIEGRIRNRTYEDREGVKKYITEVVANEMLLIKGAQ